MLLVDQILNQGGVLPPDTVAIDATEVLLDFEDKANQQHEPMVEVQGDASQSVTQMIQRDIDDWVEHPVRPIFPHCFVEGSIGSGRVGLFVKSNDGITQEYFFWRYGTNAVMMLPLVNVWEYDGDGFIIIDSYTLYDLRHERIKAAEVAYAYNIGMTVHDYMIASRTHILLGMGAMQALHRRDEVNLVYPDRAERRRAKRQTEQAKVPYKEPSPRFVIRRPKTSTSRPREVTHTKRSQISATMVAGHFRTYDQHAFIPDGTYWINPHPRGGKGNTVAAKDYRIILPKEG